MAKTASLYLTASVNTDGDTLVAGDTTIAQDLITAASNDSIVRSIIATLSGAAARIIQLIYHDGTNSFVIGTISVAANSGTDGTVASTDLLAAANIPGLPVDDNSNPYIPMKTGHKLQVAMLAALQSAETMTVVAFGEDF